MVQSVFMMSRTTGSIILREVETTSSEWYAVKINKAVSAFHKIGYECLKLALEAVQSFVFWTEERTKLNVSYCIAYYLSSDAIKMDWRLAAYWVWYDLLWLVFRVILVLLGVESYEYVTELHNIQGTLIVEHDRKAWALEALCGGNDRWEWIDRWWNLDSQHFVRYVLNIPIPK